MKLQGNSPRKIYPTEVIGLIFEIGSAYESSNRLNFQTIEELKKLRYCSVHDAHHAFMARYGANIPLKLFMKKITVLLPHVRVHMSKTGCEFFSGIALKPGVKVF